TVVQNINASARGWHQVCREFARASQLTCQALSLVDLTQLAESHPAPAGADLLFVPDASEEEFRSALLVVGPTEVLQWCEHIMSIATRVVSERLEHLPPATALGELRTFCELVGGLTEHRERLENLESSLKRA